MDRLSFEVIDEMTWVEFVCCMTYSTASDHVLIVYICRSSHKMTLKSLYMSHFIYNFDQFPQIRQLNSTCDRAMPIFLVYFRTLGLGGGYMCHRYD